MKLQRPVFLFAILIAIFPAGIPQAEATDSTDQCPRFQFNPPEAYKGGMKYSFLLPGSAGPKAGSYSSVCSGFWLSPAGVKQNWRITVSKKDDPKVEIRGVTNDHQDTIAARFVVRHPRLPDGPNLLDAHGDMRTLGSFPSYKLLEKSSPDSFEPSLQEIQEIVASVVIMELKKPENSEKKSAISGASGH
jgi:hypothetical protein